jgi:hypothetical protein
MHRLAASSLFSKLGFHLVLTTSDDSSTSDSTPLTYTGRGWCVSFEPWAALAVETIPRGSHIHAAVHNSVWDSVTRPIQATIFIHTPFHNIVPHITPAAATDPAACCVQTGARNCIEDVAAHVVLLAEVDTCKASKAASRALQDVNALHTQCSVSVGQEQLLQTSNECVVPSHALHT